MNGASEAGERERAGPRFRWTLGRKIGGLALLLLVLLVSVAGYSLLQLQGVGREIEEIAERDLPVGRLVDDLQKLVDERLETSERLALATLLRSGVDEQELITDALQRSRRSPAEHTLDVLQAIRDIRESIEVPGSSSRRPESPIRGRPQVRYARLWDLLNVLDDEFWGYFKSSEKLISTQESPEARIQNLSVVELREKRVSLAALDLSGEIRSLTEASAEDALQRQREAVRTIAAASAGGTGPGDRPVNCARSKAGRVGGRCRGPCQARRTDHRHRHVRAPRDLGQVDRRDRGAGRRVQPDVEGPDAQSRRAKTLRVRAGEDPR